MRAALTGATGFVGGHLVEALKARGDDVTCLVRSATAEPPPAVARWRCVRGDLDDARALDALVDGAEVVYHVAGSVTARSEAEYLRTNRDGTTHLVAAAARAGVRRLVYVSSIAVTGPTVPGRPLDESHPPGPLSAYGRSKRAGEDAVRAGGVPYTIVRPSVVFGPRDRETLRLFRMAARPVVTVLAGGTQELTLLYAPDLAQSLVAAATAPATVGRTYHAGHPERLTQRALMAGIAAAVGGRPRIVSLPGPVVRAGLHVAGAVARLAGRATKFDPDKANELLAPGWTCVSDALERDAGWRARTPMAVAFSETARWYRQAGWL